MLKNNQNIFIEIEILIIIHPILLIDEKIIILRIDDWEIPPILPIIILVIAINIIKLIQDENIIRIGTIFWRVRNKNSLVESNLQTISGLQEWRGAIPLFNINAIGGVIALIFDHSS